MIFPLSYIEFLSLFHGERDFFECHEVLESHWKKSGMEKNSVWVGLIQIAVSFYHYRRGNKNGAVKMMEKAVEILDKKKGTVHSLGINHDQLLVMLHKSFVDMKADSPYMPIDLPIQDIELLTVCKERVRSQGLQWGGPDEQNDYLVNKHIARRAPAVKGFERVFK